VRMTIEIITTYFQEHYLAPLFMLHYEPWTDRITVLTQKFPDNKLDDALKSELINKAIAESKSDWCIVADFDEFIFPKDFKDPRLTLEQEQGSICNCEMLRVWRHVTDKDVDRMQPPLMQRRHGQIDHVKPCIFRPCAGVKIEIGTHGASFPAHYKWGQPWSAVHWANADPEFGIQRTHSHRQTRLSQTNLKNGWGIKQEWLDVEYLKRMYESHLNDPVILEAK
jgi:hypothetical protein